MKYGIIGGTGIYDLNNSLTEKTIITPYGPVEIQTINIDEDEIIFLPRHGKGHQVLPHQVNYQGNIWALKEYGIQTILATAAVGSLRENLKIGDAVVLKDFIDFTQNRKNTFFDGKKGEIAHVSMADPYCQDLRNLLKKQGLSQEATYVCTQGPRFETAAEINFYAQIGADVVGMTNVPEVVLAKELGLCYACVGIITNMATGLTTTEATGEEIIEAVNQKKTDLTQIFIKIFKEHQKTEKTCSCQTALIKV